MPLLEDPVAADPGTILVVDDEIAHLHTLERLFQKEGWQVLVATNGQDALDVLRGAGELHVIVTDLMMPKVDGLDLLRLARKLRPEIEVILMTAFGTVERAVEGMKEGAYDFISKPIKRAAILKSVRQARERQALRAENKALRAKVATLTQEKDIIGQSAAIRQAVDLVRQVASSDVTVMLTGESGTGKELFARMLYDLSPRSERPFVALNCAALPESILEAELFGYERGAFTGATARRVGRFEAADGGTLFLDEIGEMPPHLQVKLLRVLQQGAIERLGSNDSVSIDVRIVAATHRNLQEALDDGSFREDLFYRLNVVNIRVPPLRRRAEDVPLLAQHFLAIYRQKNARQIDRISQEALEAMMAHPWPGNVRELENVIERAVVLDTDGVLGFDDLPQHMQHHPAPPRPAGMLSIPLGTSLEEIEKRVLEETLKLTGGNKKMAAQLLGIATRTIYRKL